ncbi:MAG TPA: hypothetical protein VGP02_10915 [Mycobacteriales bacterium]|jgi:hypothetical protein|nr:hypothetical protein [Mycobacteriales bacterium]
MTQPSEQSATKRDPDLSPTQIVAGALAAVSSAVAASYFGVAGTLAGAALGSVVGTVGTALYKRSLAETKEKLRTTIVPIQTVVLRRRGEATESTTVAGGTEAPVHPAATTGDTAPEPAGRPGAAPQGPPAGSRHWARTAAFALVAFVLALGGVSAVEAAAGRTLSSLVTGGQERGTTVGHVTGGDPAPRPRPVPTSSPTVTPTVTPSASPSASPSPGPSATTTVPTPGTTSAPASPPAVPSPSP